MSKISVTKRQLGNTLSIGKGDTILVELPENATTGYKWILKDSSRLSVSELFVPNAENAPGSAGIAQFEIEPNAGLDTKKITFQLKRPWETEVEEEFWINLTVE